MSFSLGEVTLGALALAIVLAGLEQKLNGSLGSVQKREVCLFFGFPTRGKITAVRKDTRAGYAENALLKRRLRRSRFKKTLYRADCPVLPPEYLPGTAGTHRVRR